MGYTILSLLVFGVAIYLFIITNRKIQAIKDETVSSEMREEMDALITEFNRTATRNIELLEDRIQEVEKVLLKADKRMELLDDRISRANRPIVVEKIIEKPAPARRETPPETESAPVPVPRKTENRTESPRKPAPEKEEKPAANATEKLSRSEQLKELMRQGKSEQELMEMGYQINEIKLLRFLIK